MLLLHGMGGVGKIWRPVAAALEGRFDVLAPDQRAHGQSRAIPPSSPCTPEAFGKDLVETLHALNFQPTWVVGHSMGVRSALALAHLKPEWVQGLVLIDVGVTSTPGAALIQPLMDFLSKLPSQFPDRASMRSYIDAHAPDPSYGPYLTAVSVPLPNGSVGFPFDIHRLLETHDFGAQASARGDFEAWTRETANLGIPVHLLHGGKSKVWTQKAFETEKALFQSVPNIYFHDWPSAGHGLPFERRPEFTAWLEKTILA